ncbi:MFS transporter [alpha proteobacterium AAP81b]|nr:MFS transporter [alpha proteobacterium AAP81b]
MATLAATDMPARGTSERLLLWTLLIVYILNFLDRQIVTILAEPIRKDLGLADWQLGLLGGFAFAAFYAVLGIPIARHVDKPATNRVTIITVSLALWSGMTALCGLASGFVQLLLCRVGVGVGEAGCTPSAHSLIADSVAADRRGRAIAFYGLGIPIGSLLGTIIGGQLADAFGWRTAFFVVGMPGLLMALFVWASLRDPRAARPAPAVAPPPAPSLRAALAGLAGNRCYVLLVTAAALVAFLSYGKGQWALSYFQRTHGLTPGQAGLFVGGILGLAGIAGTWAGGWLGDRFGHRHMVTAPAIGMAVAAPILFAGYMTDDWRMAIALLVLPTLLNSMYYGPAYASAQLMVPRESRAMASAVMLFAQNFIGLGLGPLLFGLLSDAFKPMAGTESVRWVLLIAAWAGLLPAFFFWRAGRRMAAAIADNQPAGR